MYIMPDRKTRELRERAEFVRSETQALSGIAANESYRSMQKGGTEYPSLGESFWDRRSKLTEIENQK